MFGRKMIFVIHATPGESLAPLKSKLDSNYSSPKDDVDEVQQSAELNDISDYPCK